MVSHPHASPARAPRANLDSLAIGAPLTAALVGVLLTEGEGALGNAAAGASAAAGVAAPHGDEAGAASHHEMAGARLGPAAPSALGARSAASSGGEIFDPVATSNAAAPAGSPASTAAGTLVPPGATPEGMDSQAALSAGTNITLGTGAAPDGFGLDGIPTDGASSAGRIGTTITGTDGDDVIHGTPHDDALFGGAGDDTIYGHQGDDLLDGGAGHDQLFGGSGNDSLLGGSGNDRLSGGTGDDGLFGGSGNDRLLGEEGRDWLDGGPAMTDSMVVPTRTD